MVACHSYGTDVAATKWWAGQPGERFWLEITDREDLGANLHAPQVDGSGRENWTYELVRHVRPGDVVFHWWKRPGRESGIVAASTVVGEPVTSTIRWQAHGTYGRSRAAQISPSWCAPLADFTELDDPVTLARLRAVEGDLRAAHASLAAQVGTALYFPFAFSDKRPLRTTQGYLTKLPAAVVDLLPELRPAPGVAETGTSTAKTVTRRPGSGGRQQRTDVRRAIERHAVEWTMAHFEARGYDVLDVGATESYDVLALRDGEEVHVEVKGSSSDAFAVELTDNEVAHRIDNVLRALVVVDHIDWFEADGAVLTKGGRPRVWFRWEISADALVSTRYRYTLPVGGDLGI